MIVLRLLLIMLAAAVFIINSSSVASAQAQRKSITALTPVELHGFRRGVAVMMSRNTAPRDSADFRRSWAYWANVHAHFGSDCAGPIPGTARGMGTVQEWSASNQAEQATWCSCQHGTDFFLTWHRMALWYFERVLQEAAGMPTLRLPYWDVNAHPTLPPVFRALTYVDESGKTVPNPLYVADRAAGVNAGTAAIGSFARSARNALSATGYSLFRSRIENNPHGSVHCALSGGCPNGLMGNVSAAALDPIFWLHHANIDRVYECWLRQNEARRLPTGGTHLDWQYSFVDADGSVVTRRVRDMLRTSQLGYRYTAGSDCPTTSAALDSQEQIFLPRMEAAVEHEHIILAQGKPTSAKKPIEWGKREKVKLPKADKQVRQRALKIRGLSYDQHPGVMYDVLLAGPNGVEQVGVMSFFSDEHHAHSKEFDFDLTAAIKALGLRPGDEPEVVFEPTTGLDTSTPEQAARQANPRANLGYERLEVVTE